MSSLKPICPFLLVSLAACGGSDPDGTPKKPIRPVIPLIAKDVGEAKVRDHVPVGSVFSSRLGQGYEGVNGEMRDSCASGPEVSVATPGLFLRFAQPLTAAEEESVLGAPAGAWQRFSRWDRAFAPAAETDPRSVTLTYAAERRTSTTRLDAAAVSWLVDPASPEFVRCGDQVVAEVEQGGRLLVRFQLRFATAEAQDLFKQLAGPTPAVWEVESILSANPDFFPSNEVSTGLKIVQQGGNPAALIGRLQAGSGIDTFTSCMMGVHATCALVVQSVVALVTAEGPGSLAEAMAAAPARLGYRLAGWDVVGGPLAARFAPNDVLMARRALDALAVEQLQVKDRLGTLSVYGSTLAPGLGAGLDELAWRVDANLRALDAAGQLCFSLTGPEDRTGAEACLAGATPAGLAAAGFDSTLNLASIP